MNPTKSEAIKNFLMAKARPEFAELYNLGMEVQVNVAQGLGERVDLEYEGTQYAAWEHDGEIWKSFRIPLHANTEPTYDDKPLNFNLSKHAEGIGMTGWDWMNKKSLWVAFDFDAIVGHSEKHTSKLTDAELAEVKRAAFAIPWVTVVKSTSGNGLHLYVFLEPVDTKNHNEHAALARAILSLMSARTGFDFNSKVDNCGHIMWVWHRKFDKVGGVEGEGLKIIQRGEKLKEPPTNWQDHIRVSSGKRSRTIPEFVQEHEIDWFEQMCGQHVKTPLDSQHRALIGFLEENAEVWWFDIDHHMLVCHTHDLKKAHKKLGLRGVFDTTSSGGSEQNCFMFPLRNGGWVVRRHTPGVQEAEIWDQDNSGWTRCYFNREPDLKIAAKANHGAEDENGSFAFNSAKDALDSIKILGAAVELDEAYHTRAATLKPSKDNRLVFEIERVASDNPQTLLGWINKGKVWRKVLNSQLPARYEQEVTNHDDVVRHVVSQGGDAGWCIRSENTWQDEPLQHMKLALKSLGNSAKDSELILGQAILKPWILVNRPFQPEYLGDREWNRESAQLAFHPTEDIDNLHYPTWMSLLSHCGKNITHALTENPWAKANGVKTGAEYLMLWISCIFQQPTEPLPYLFFYGEQGTGKTIFHEAISILVTKGVVRADAALISQSGFNGELANAILCVIEETDLRQNRTMAYNRIKDWVTGKTLSLHIKGATPITMVNTTHWIQCTNEFESCPIFPGDTRITMVHVEHVAKENYIPKSQLLAQLKKEAPDFLAKIMSLPIPESPERLLIPALESSEKDQAAEVNQSDLSLFLKENCHNVTGEHILIADFYERFQEWLDPERRHIWSSKQKISRDMPHWVLKGRLPSMKSMHAYGNISWTPLGPGEIAKPPLILSGDKLIPE